MDTLLGTSPSTTWVTEAVGEEDDEEEEAEDEDAVLLVVLTESASGRSADASLMSIGSLGSGSSLTK